MMRPVEIEPGIEGFAVRTPTLPPATHTNSYALGQRDVLLVEPSTPYEDEQRDWLAWAEGQRSRGRKLTGILLTHHHPDHAGGAEFLSRALDIPLFAHDETARRLPDLPVARRLEDGEDLLLEGPTPQKWRVLRTPGHAAGHLCLFEPELRALIAGDMVATEGTILVDTRDGDMRAYIEQLGRLRQLGARVALPAHGAPITEPALLFDYYVRHRLARESKILGALRTLRHGGTVAEVVPIAYADTPPAVWAIAALSTAAHLVKLEQDGLVAGDGRTWRAIEGAPECGAT
jgi:glyoxylase-like metal-dependent hydrolase (beta-lactamase superfamily II)